MRQEDELIQRDLAVDPRIRLDTDEPRDPFFSAEDVDLVITVFEIGEIEDVLKRRPADELIIEDLFVPRDGDVDHAVVGVLNGDAELHAIFRYRMDAYFEVRRCILAVGGMKRGQSKGDKKG